MASPSELRFVVLRHETPAGSDLAPHWDFMLEVDGVLRAWALDAWPADEPEIAARLLADHRLAYLEYEGPISGGRGAVARCDGGTYRPVFVDDDCWEVELFGDRLRGTALLERRGQGWRLAFKKA